MTDRPTSPAPPRRPLGRRLLIGALAVAGTLIVLAGAALWIAMATLDSVPVRSWLSERLRQATGLQVSWQATDVSLAGRVRILGLRLANPPPWDAREPDLLSIETLHVEGSIPALLRGRIHLERVALQGIRGIWMRDAQGSNLDGFQAPDTPHAEAPQADSLVIRGPKGLAVRVDSLSVEDVSVTVIDDTAGPTAGRATLAGVGAWGEIELAPDGALTGSLKLGGPEGGTTLSVQFAPADAPRRTGRLGLDVGIEVRDESATARIRLDVADQTLWGGLPASFQALVLDATADTRDGSARLEVRELDLMSGALTGRFSGRLGQRETLLHVDEAVLRMDAATLPKPLRALVPLTWEGQATLDLVARNVAVTTTAPHLGPGGSLVLRGAVDRLVARAGERVVTLNTFRPELTLAPQGDAAAVTGSADVGRITVSNQGRPEVDAVRPRVGLEGTLRLEGSSDLALRLDLDTLDATVGDTRLALREGALRLRLPLDGALPTRLDGTLTLGPSRAWVGTRDVTLPATSLDATLDDLAWNPAAPAASTGRLGLVGRVGDVALDARLIRDLDGADVRLALDAPSLGILRPLMPPGAPRIHWEQAGARGTASGRITLPRPVGGATTTEGGAASDWSADVSLDATLRHLHLRHADHRIQLAQASVRGSARAGVQPLRLRATLAVTPPVVDGRRAAYGLAGDVRLDATPARPSLKVEVRTTGLADPMHVRLDAGWRRSDRSLDWHLDTALRDPGPLGRLLGRGDGILPDLSQARLVVRSNGTLTGVVRRVEGGGPILFPDAMERARGTATLEALLDVPGRDAVLHQARIATTLDATTPQRRLTTKLDVPSAEVLLKQGRFQATALTGDLTFVAQAPPTQGMVNLTGTVNVGTVTRNGADLAWPIGTMSLVIGARLDRLISLRVDRLTVENARSGTRLEATAAVDLADLPGVPGGRSEGIERIVGRQAIAIQGTLDQDLARIVADPKTFAGTGTVRVPFRLESGDGTVYRVDATVASTNVTLRLPSLPLELHGVNGQTPITEVVALGPDGRISLVRAGDTDAWSRVRFADQHPFLARGTYVSMSRLDAGPLSLRPVAGNLRITGNSLRLDQMEAAWRGGKATGQLILDLVPGDLGVGFRGNVTGIRAGRTDEVLDANAALTASLGRMSIEGRLHLNRVGRGHVRDLLDAFDPWSEQPTANRVRKWLALGYPKSVRVEFRHNAMTAGVELGGIAGIVRIDEIRGIPIAPLLRRTVGPWVPGKGVP